MGTPTKGFFMWHICTIFASHTRDSTVQCFATLQAIAASHLSSLKCSLQPWPSQLDLLVNNIWGDTFQEHWNKIKSILGRARLAGFHLFDGWPSQLLNISVLCFHHLKKWRQENQTFRVGVKTKEVNSCNPPTSYLGYNKYMKAYAITIVTSIQIVITCSFILGRIKEKVE